jgi:hypothetical protein
MRGRSRGLLAGGIVAAGLLVAMVPVRADSPPLKYINPETFSDNPAGTRAGELLFHSYIAAGTIYDSNVFSSPRDAVSDRILFLRPGLSVSTLDPNRTFNLRVSLDHLEYERFPDESRTDPRGELTGRLRLQRNLELDTFLSASRPHEERSLLRRDLPGNAAEPIVHNEYLARVALRGTYNRLVLTTTAAYENENYFNVRSIGGAPINLQALDRDVLKIGQEAELKLSHRLRLFSRVTLNDTDYREVAGFIERDSTKVELVSGVEVALTPLIKALFLHHYSEERFKATSIESEPEIFYRTELTWSPLRYLRLRAGAAREFGGVSFDLDRSGGRRTRADFNIDYDITRQLLLRGSFNYLHANEAGLAAGEKRVEDTYQYRASLVYQLNRYWNLFLDYAVENRDANIEGNQLDRHIVQMGVVARF